MEGLDKTKIKICGLTRDEDIFYVNESKPDYIGFVFAKRSRRYVTEEQSRRLREALDPEIQAVGVFVNEEPEQVAKLLEEGIIDLAQLHGDEDEAYIQRLRKLTNKPLIQAFCITDSSDLLKAKESRADYLLLDAPQAGSGKTFDWTLVQDMERPFFLAGGLTIDNVQEGIKRFHPYGVDVSSGVETCQVKDKDKIKQLIRLIRS